MKTKINFYLAISVILIIIVSVVYTYIFLSRAKAPTYETYTKVANPYQKVAPTKPIITEPTDKAPASPAQPTIPDKAILEVSFQVQAPDANWDSLHEEACEEASLIMVAHYLAKDKPGGEAEIQKLVQWETDNSYKPDVTLNELSEIAQKYYQINSGRVETAVTIEKIKQEIADGKPVIVPAAGKVLPNPYFSNGGPNYHMLVIIGYDQENFITNDPGTKRGQGLKYKYSDLLKSIHDWDPNNILNGQKAYLVFD